MATSPEIRDQQWQFAKSLAELRENKVMLVRVAGKQIALFDTPNGPRACDNRCPHEGYPLSEGDLSKDCQLTCNWHNWKFDLDTGENLYGGDRLRIYPVAVRGDEVWLDITDPPFKVQYAACINNLRDAFDDHEYDRIAREIARLTHIGGEPLDALRHAIEWSWERLEFGWTHAYAGMAVWLQLYDEHPHDREIQLACLTESVAHISFDVLRQKDYPYANDPDGDVGEWDESVFLQAIENEDASRAVACIRGGLGAGLQVRDFEPALTQAALAHYNDFGHSLIYVTKAVALIERLGEQVAEPLLLSLTREILFASREDRIPEFRGYTKALTQWGQLTPDLRDIQPKAAHWRKKGINKALAMTIKCSGADPGLLYQELLQANAVNLLSFDIAQQDKVRVSVSGNVGWLDFTHGLTFANAVRKQCTRYPSLWPQGLLQMACFSGRNAAFTTDDDDLARWRPNDIEQGFKELIAEVIDHGQPEYIISVHWLKTVLAAREECRQLPDEVGVIVFASVNRFIHSRMRRRQVRRTAHKSINFVEKA